MGFEYAGETGLLAGFTWVVLCNVQRALPWYRMPWLHATGMFAGYYLAKGAAAWEDQALAFYIQKYERKGYVIPEDRKELFFPKPQPQQS
ncbi:hypothetical protein QJQ45_004732 [Haematococcus lacustris]|nr:hypothetical protein QJQ45_004732 [Haematococcus lacustris]